MVICFLGVGVDSESSMLVSLVACKGRTDSEWDVTENKLFGFGWGFHDLCVEFRDRWISVW